MFFIKFVIVVLLLIAGEPSPAFWGKSWLDVYECGDLGQSKSCKSCKRVDQLQVKFTVNSQTQSVMRQFREGETVSPPHKILECEVLDQKNWSCASERPHKTSIVGMGGGVYSSWERHINVRGEVFYEPYICAK